MARLEKQSLRDAVNGWVWPARHRCVSFGEHRRSSVSISLAASLSDQSVPTEESVKKKCARPRSLLFGGDWPLWKEGHVWAHGHGGGAPGRRSFYPSLSLRESPVLHRPGWSRWPLSGGHSAVGRWTSVRIFSAPHGTWCLLGVADVSWWLFVLGSSTVGSDLSRGEVKCLVAKSCLTLCNPMDCTTACSSILHYCLQVAQIHVGWVGDAI